jgi:hypothetical protein
MKFTFPELPDCKLYDGKMTPEQRVFDKLVHRQEVSESEEKILKDTIDFYKITFDYLKSINLSIITEEESNTILEFLHRVFNIEVGILNDISNLLIFRVSIIKDSFLENGKVRDPMYLSYPVLDLIQKSGIYNRANSPNTTVLYASFNENVALRETKPVAGSRIIISKWVNDTGKQFHAYPITNNDSVDNLELRRATQAFLEAKKDMHPLVAEITDLHLKFLSSEFIKDTPIMSSRRYEYLFSSFFAEKILSGNNPEDTYPETELIIYPSIAYKHREENLALSPKAVTYLKIVELKEYRVINTNYDSFIDVNQKAANLDLMRSSDWIEDHLIIWDD